MKPLKLTLPFFAAVLTASSLVLGLVAGTSPTAHASAAAETRGTQHCSAISGTDKLASQRRAACKKGFVGGYDGGDKARTCKGLSKTPKKDCEDNFDAGKRAKAKAPETDGREGAGAKKSKGATCNKYNNKASKATCEKSYDNQQVAMAQTAGEKAGKAGDPSPCASLRFGGAKAKAACEESYKKGQNEAGKNSRYKCGDVDTYFNYGKACEGTDKKAGGNKSPIIAIGLTVIGWLTALVALAVVGGIVYGGFLYLTARDNSSQTQKGVTVITNSVVALIAWLFAYALINFLVPGGLFNG